MKLTDRFQTIISLLTSIWLMVFVCLSTSHMGTPHHIPLLETTSGQIELKQTQHVDTVHCQWTYAALMTIGDMPILAIHTMHELADIMVLVQSCYVASEVLVSFDPRGPPTSS